MIKIKKPSYKYKEIQLSDIILYEENPRFEKAFSDVEAIQKMIQNQGTKLVKLAEHIIDNGFNPIDIPAVIKDSKTKKFLMKEGNRRIIAPMLVWNPNLIFSNEPLKNKFLLLKSQKGHLLPEKIFCAVFEDPHDVDEWIRLKHAVHHEGVGIEKWNSEQANRFAKGSIEDFPIELQAIEILKKNKKTSKSTKDLIPTIKTTNLRRLLSDPYIRSKIGLSYENNKLKLLKPERESLKNLEVTIQEISKQTFVVTNIYRQKDRKEFIDSIKLKKIKLLKPSLPEKKKKDKKKEKESYTSLIDPSKELPIKVSPKISKIYKELQTISVDAAPHATAALLRILIEISVKSYLKKKKITIDSYDCAIVTINGRTSKYESLKKKINYIANTHITDNDLKNSVNLLNKSSFAKTLNQFIHNELHQSTPNSVREFWVNAENLFEFLIS